MDEGLESFDTTQENLCEECGAENVEVAFIRYNGLRMQACHSCRDKIAKEVKGESKSFLAYFTEESRSILYEIGVTGADNMNIVASKLLKEVKKLREELLKLKTEPLIIKIEKEVSNASII